LMEIFNLKSIDDIIFFVDETDSDSITTE